MTFEEWKAVQGGSKYSLSATFAAGVDVGRKEAARDIIQFIMDQGTIQCGKDDPYFIVEDDLVFLRGKYRLDDNTISGGQHGMDKKQLTARQHYLCAVFR